MKTGTKTMKCDCIWCEIPQRREEDNKNARLRTKKQQFDSVKIDGKVQRKHVNDRSRGRQHPGMYSVRPDQTKCDGKKISMNSRLAAFHVGSLYLLSRVISLLPNDLNPFEGAS